MALALDGSASATAAASNVSASLTTSNANDVIYAIVVIDTGTSISVPTATGLTFQQRGSTGINAGSYGIAAFYAVASSALSSLSISATASGNNDITLIVFGVSGANTTSPFDSNSSIPTVTSTASATINTSNANDLIIGGIAVASAPSLTIDSGFTQITSLKSGDNFVGAEAEYEVVTAKQSNLVIAFSGQGANPYGIVADAVVAASGGPTVPIGIPAIMYPPASRARQLTPLNPIWARPYGNEVWRVAVHAGYSRSNQDSFPLSDSLSKKTSIPLSENFSLLDKLAKKAGLLLAESISLSDKLAKKTGLVLSESISLLDKLARKTIIPLSESFSLTDVLAVKRVIVKALSEAFSLTDSLARKTAKTLSQTITLSDSLKKQTTLILRENVALLDKLAKKTSKLLSGAFSLLDSLLVARVGNAPIRIGYVAVQEGQMILSATQGQMILSATEGSMTLSSERV